MEICNITNVILGFPGGAFRVEYSPSLKLVAPPKKSARTATHAPFQSLSIPPPPPPEKPHKIFQKTYQAVDLSSETQLQVAETLNY